MIRITFFKEFTLSENGKTLSEKTSGAKKLFRALAYLVKNRDRRVTADEFSRFLHDYAPAKKGSSDSLVKVTVHRLRELLSLFSEGETLLFKDGGIYFSPTLTFSSDADELDEVFSSYESATDNESRFFLFEKARALYQGRYLAPFFGEGFTMPEAERYHRRFLSLCEDAFARLMAEACFSEITKIAQKLTAIDPYSECFHYYRISALIALGDKMLASSLYHSVSELFRREYRITPSIRFRELGSRLTTAVHFTVSDAKDALDQLKEAFLRHPDRAVFSDPLDFYRALSLSECGNLLLITGDTDKLSSDVFRLFSEKTVFTKLSPDTLFLFSALDEDTFSRHFKTLSHTVDYAHYKIRLKALKYPDKSCKIL